MQRRGLANTYISVTPDSALAAPSSGFASSGIATEVRPRYRQSSRQRLVRRTVREAAWDRGVAEIKSRGFSDSYARTVPNTGGVTFEGATSPGSGYGIVAEARRYLGGNPTSRSSLWCARFMNMVLQHTGHRGTGSDMASSFANYGQRISGPQVGAIAVMTRGRSGGHVGIITGIDAKGNPIMISGNNGNRVREAPVSRGRIYAYVMPN